MSFLCDVRSAICDLRIRGAGLSSGYQPARARISDRDLVAHKHQINCQPNTCDSQQQGESNANSGRSPRNPASGMERLYLTEMSEGGADIHQNSEDDESSPKPERCSRRMTCNLRLPHVQVRAETIQNGPPQNRSPSAPARSESRREMSARRQNISADRFPRKMLFRKSLSHS